MSDDYIYYGPETAALEISSDGKVQWVIPRAITVDKGSATPMGDGFDKYRQYDQDLRDAYTAGLYAARKAVGDLPHPMIDVECECGACAALAAIDALREEQAPPPLPPSVGVPSKPMWPLREEQK